ncbi:MAG: Hsp20/alpha crystallin family protein [Spirochaetaceae bacterium]|nr:MAG: Hsp20/alpha crystallin family protein [Spirochaetaceae bacterium]
MNLVKYSPMATSIFGRDIDSIFDSVFDQDFWDTGTHYPKVDVREEKDRYILEADLPGLTERDIEVKVENNLLTVASSKKEEKEEKKNGYLVKERKESSFARSFVLPDNVARDRISASFKSGVLTLTLEKSPEAQPKKIDVKGE